MKNNMKQGYRCEKCGDSITLEEYLSFDILSIAKCKTCNKSKKTSDEINFIKQFEGAKCFHGVK